MFIVFSIHLKTQIELSVRHRVAKGFWGVNQVKRKGEAGLNFQFFMLSPVSAERTFNKNEQMI